MTISEDELRAYYDEACASAEMTYTADPQSYENDRLSGVSVFWNPQGYRRVKRVLIPFSAENAARMQELTAQISGGDESRDQRRRRRDGRHLRLPGRHCAGSAVAHRRRRGLRRPHRRPMALIPIWPRAAPAGKRATTSASAASCSTRTSSPRPWRSALPATSPSPSSAPTAFISSATRTTCPPARCLSRPSSRTRRDARQRRRQPASQLLQRNGRALARRSRDRPLPGKLLTPAAARRPTRSGLAQVSKFSPNAPLTNRHTGDIIIPVLRSWRNWHTRTFEGRVGDRTGSSPVDRTTIPTRI